MYDHASHVHAPRGIKADASLCCSDCIRSLEQSHSKCSLISPLATTVTVVKNSLRKESFICDVFVESIDLHYLGKEGAALKTA